MIRYNLQRNTLQLYFLVLASAACGTLQRHSIFNCIQYAQSYPTGPKIDIQIEGGVELRDPSEQPGLGRISHHDLPRVLCQTTRGRGESTWSFPGSHETAFRSSVMIPRPSESSACWKHAWWATSPGMHRCHQTMAAGAVRTTATRCKPLLCAPSVPALHRRMCTPVDCVSYSAVFDCRRFDLVGRVAPC